MIQCQFCNSTTQPSYIYAECTHFVCLDCAALKWDRKYSFKCCNKITFLEEDTCITLEKVNNQEEENKDDCKENIAAFPQKTPTPIKNRKEDIPLKNRQVQQSIYISQFESKPDEKAAGYSQGQSIGRLGEMEQIMSENIHRIKATFESYRKELQKREEVLLKEVYNKYSDHLSGLSHQVTEEDTVGLREKLKRVVGEELGRVCVREGEGKGDKILEKLEYNQVKMKEKLSRHYDLLK